MIVSISISVAVLNISCFVISRDVLLKGKVIHCLNETTVIAMIMLEPLLPLQLHQPQQYQN